MRMTISTFDSTSDLTEAHQNPLLSSALPNKTISVVSKTQGTSEPAGVPHLNLFE